MASRVSTAFRRTTRSAAETRRLGRSLGASLEPGDLLCLRGELGAGKTTFVQGIAQGLGVPDAATSPSFTLLHEHRGRLPFFHLDLYRITSSDLGEVGLEEIIGTDAVVAVEWAERLPRPLCEDGLEIAFQFSESSPQERVITMRAHGPRGRRMLRRLAGRSHARTRP